MKPKWMLTIAGLYYILDAIAEIFQAGGFDFTPSAYTVFGLSFGALFLLIRNEPGSKARDAIFVAGFLSSLGVGLVAFYAQWIGTFMDSAVGYISSLLWFLIAAGFLLVGRANMSTQSK
jgi:apolipoprotein N-acyltransferase